MIIQGSNTPIILTIDGTDFTTIQDFSAGLYSGRVVSKLWDMQTALLSNGKVILPLSETETLKLTAGKWFIEAKWVDKNAVCFAKNIEIEVAHRMNKHEFGVGSLTDGDGEEIPISEDETREIIIVKQNVGSGGSNGYTPVRGTDYWTAADIAEIKGYVDSAILNGSW